MIALALRIGRFPPGGDDLPVTLNIRRAEAYWVWDRDFSGHRTLSRVSFDQTRDCVREKIGGLTIWLQPVPTETGLAIEIRRLCLFGIPCPRILLPRSASTESEDAQSRFRFDISARLPGIGLLIRYRGWLAPDHTQRSLG
ncbi:NAD(P)-binding dehydrogenase [Ruegeria sp. ANG-R]|nr:NAD(P)-binding dehydrogenase [Ruegeria sp. ANG-R]